VAEDRLSFGERIQQAHTQAANAHLIVESGIQKYAMYASMGKWTAAEEVRLEILASMESYLDGMAMMYRAMQDAKDGDF
jgi:hypothetical protein